MGSVITELNSKSADVDLNFAAAASSFASVVFRSPAANAELEATASPSPKINKRAKRIGLVESSFWVGRRKRRTGNQSSCEAKLSHLDKPASIRQVAVYRWANTV